MDPTTGTIDMDLIQTGISAGDRTLRAQLTQEVRALIQRASLTTPLCIPSPSTLNVHCAAILVGSVHGVSACVCAKCRELSSFLPVACLQEFACRAESRGGSMGLSELLTAINGQSSVPVSEVELKDTLRTLGSDISVNWTARTVQMVDVLA